MLRDHVQTAFADALKTSDFTLLKPKHAKFGDYSVNVIPFRNEVKPENIVAELEKSPLFHKVELVGAFINVFLSQEHLKQEIININDQKDTYGSSNWGTGKTWLIEHTSPNPNKAMHLGHLRNNVTGMAIAHIAEHVGVKVIKGNIDNNRGIAIARLMWGYLKFGHRKESPTNLDHLSINYWYDNQDDWHTPESAQQNPAIFVDKLYVQASQDFKENEDIQQKVRQLVVDWESEDTKVWALWKRVLSYSYAGQDITLNRIGNKWDIVWHEHEHYKEGKKYVEKGLKKGIFKKTSEGTIITQIEKDYNLPETVLLKSDGTSLYITQDIALTDKKFQETKADILHWVVGPEQSLAMQQMFAVCEQLGIGSLNQFKHISYGFMSLKNVGKMSSREGTVVYIDDLLDQAAKQARALIKNPKEVDIDSVSETVGVGAVKYGLLKVSRNQNIAFDFDDSVSFDGNSGPYIQYVYARMYSLLEKAKVDPEVTDAELTDEDIMLMRTLQRFPEVVLEAAQTYSPHYICTYLFELAQTFNSLYEAQQIHTEDTELAQMRLALVQAAGHVVHNGLKLLGIDTVKHM